MANVKNEKKKHSKFFFAAWSVVAFFAIATAIILVVLWNFLSAFEKSDARYYLDQVVDAIEAEEYEDAAALAHFEETEFFTQEQYINYLRETFSQDEDLRVLEAKAENPGEKVFRVKGKNGELRFVLTEQPNTLDFGLSSYTVKQQLGEGGTWTIEATAGVPVWVNGVELRDEHRVNKDVIPTMYTTLNDTSLAPKLAVYEVSGLYTTPNVSIDGEAPVITHDLENNRVTALIGTPAIPKDREEALLNAAKTYAYYISGDVSFNKVKAFLYKDTAFYTCLLDYSSYWYIDHDSATFENLAVTNYTEYSTTAYSAEISFDYRVKRGTYVNNVYPTHYRISFAEIDGKMMVVNIETL